MTKELVLLSWSGGKDSSLALAALRADPGVEVVGLMTSVTREYDRISIHGVRRVLLEQQARSIGLPLFELHLEADSSNEAYKSAFNATIARVRKDVPSLAGVAFGDLFLEDVRLYRERLVEPLALKAHFPLWLRPTRRLAEQFIGDGYDARLVCVDTTQLAAGFSGRAFDRALLEELPVGVDPCGERGEFHTFVADGPIFSAPIAYTRGEVVMRGERFAYCDLVPGIPTSSSPAVQQPNTPTRIR